MKLLRYDEITEKMYEDYIGEWIASGDLIVPSATNNTDRSYAEVLENLKFEETESVYEKGLVKATLFYLVVDEKIVGAIHFRHELNDYLLKFGGHVGYGVKPGERKKGYGSVMLELLLETIKFKNLDKVLITCDDTNIGSYKTIEKSGGVLENKVDNNGKLTRRYWIDLIKHYS